MNKTKKAKKIKVKHQPGTKYTQAAGQVNPNQDYPLDQAVSLAKQTSFTGFDATVEVHLTLGVNPAEPDQRVRTTVSLPAGTGKSLKVLAFADGPVPGADLLGEETTISQLLSGQLKGGQDFDVIVATPAWMPKMAKLGPVLGPQGLLPNPKNGTVTNDPAGKVSQLKQGQVEIRLEQKAPLVHTIIGKVSFSDEDLIRNFEAVRRALDSARPNKVKPADYIKKITITSTMGPGVKVRI